MKITKKSNKKCRHKNITMALMIKSKSISFGFVCGNCKYEVKESDEVRIRTKFSKK